jgi:hypothetical protein
MSLSYPQSQLLGMAVCNICGKTLYSKQSLQRHMNVKHTTSGDSDSNQDTSEAEMEEHSDDEASTTKDAASDSEAESEEGPDDSASDSDVWESLLEEVFEENDNIRADDGEIKWSKVIKRVKAKVYTWLSAANNIRDSQTFEKYRKRRIDYRNKDILNLKPKTQHGKIESF